MTSLDFVLFFLSTVGMSHIIVDGSIFESFRSFIKSYSEKLKVPHLGTIVECYMCSGTWCGFFMGYVWISDDLLKIFACGCAGGFVSNFAAIIINYFESLTIVNLPDNTNKSYPDPEDQETTENSENQSND